MTMIRIGALISGSGTNLAAVMDACRAGRVDGKVVFAGADNPAATGLAKAEAAGIPTFVVDYRSIIRQYRANPGQLDLPDDFDPDRIAAEAALFESGLPDEKILDFLKTRAVAEAALLSHLSAWPFDLLILAGFMRKLTPYFIDRINLDPDRPRIMNIHPALLPAFPGQDGYGDTWRYGCKVGGCTVHFIDYGEDTGPIIGQKSFAITSRDTLATVREKGLALEWELYPECIQLFATNRLSLEYRQQPGEAGPGQRRVVVVS
ncbi:MAG: phosphoribosylglycinamide formyltransferase [Desulfosudaceae bacterium]